jgi:tyrosyl-tRNA synthetase
LARELTERVHGAEALRLAELTSELLFGKGTTEQLQQLSEGEIREVFQGVPVHEISDQAFRSASSLVDLLAENAPVFPSKGEARRKIKSGALAVNKQKITEEVAPSSLALLQNRYLLVQNGKKNYHLIVVS